MHKKETIMYFIACSLFLLLLVLADCSLADDQFPISINGRSATVSASSTLKTNSTPNRYMVTNLFDGDVNSAWVEGVENNGVGEYIEIKFNKPQKIDGVVIFPGYLKSAKTFITNATPSEIEITVNNNMRQKYQISYVKEMSIPAANTESIREMGCYHKRDPANLGSRLILFKHTINAQTLQFKLTSILSGSKYQDTAISEISFIFTAGDTGKSIVPPEIIKILLQLRSGQPLKPFVSEKIFVEDLRTKYICRDPGKGYDYFDTLADDKKGFWVPRVKELKKTDSDLYDKFFTYTQNSFIASAVAVVVKKDLTYLIGSRSFSFGDSEYLEFYPTLVLDIENKIVRALEFSHFDGVPGCSFVIPEIVATQQIRKP